MKERQKDVERRKIAALSDLDVYTAFADLAREVGAYGALEIVLGWCVSGMYGDMIQELQDSLADVRAARAPGERARA